MDRRALQCPLAPRRASVCLRRQHLSRVPQRKAKMFRMKKLFSNFQPPKGLLKWQRKRTAKVVPGDVLAGTQKDDAPRQPSPSHTALASSSSQPVDKWQWQAAAQEGDNHVSSLVLEDQVRPAGPEGQAAAPHSPCCTPSPFSSQMQALSGQQARAAVAEILPVPMEGTCSEEGSLWDISSLLELSQSVEITEQSWTTGEESSSMSLPLELWAEPSQSSTPTLSVPALSSTSPYTRANAPTPGRFLDHNDLSPSPSQLESLSGQRAGAAAGSSQSVAKEGTWSEGHSVWDNSSLLKLFHGQDKTHIPLPPVEDISRQEPFQYKAKKIVKIHTICVRPLYVPALQSPQSGCQEGPKRPRSTRREAAEEADAAAHSTRPALREPTDTQAAAAGLAAAPQQEGHRTALAAKAPGVAKTAASPALGEQGRPAGPEGQAAAPHSPRGFGRAVLDTLQRWARATLRRIALGIRRRGQQPQQQRDVEKDTDVAIAGTATAAAAGPESQAAAPHSPSWPHSRSITSLIEALIGRQAGPAVEAFQPVTKEGTSSEDGSLWDTSSPLERCKREENTELRWTTEEESSSVSLPCELWAEPRDSHPGTSTQDDSGLLEAGQDVNPYHGNPQTDTGTDTDLKEEGLFPRRQSATSQGTELQAVAGDTSLKDILLAWDRRSFEKLPVKHSPAAVPAQQPSLFRRALEALRRAFPSLHRATGWLGPERGGGWSSVHLMASRQWCSPGHGVGASPLGLLASISLLPVLEDFS